MGQRHQARTPASPAPMLALLERVWWGCAPKPGAVGGNGNFMVIFFYPFLMSLPLPSTAGRGRQERRGHGGRWQGTKQRDLLFSRP